MEAVTMMKVAALAAQNKNNIGKVLTVLLGILLAPVILILMVYVQVMSAFSPDGLLQSPDSFDGANSVIYQSIHAVTNPFYEEIDAQLDAAESDIQQYSTYVYDIIDDQGRTQTVRDEPGITKKRHYISESVIIASISQQLFIYSLAIAGSISLQYPPAGTNSKIFLFFSPYGTPGPCGQSKRTSLRTGL